MQSYLSIDISGKEDLFCFLYHLLSHTESCPTGCTVSPSLDSSLSRTRSTASGSARFSPIPAVAPAASLASPPLLFPQFPQFPLALGALGTRKGRIGRIGRIDPRKFPAEFPLRPSSRAPQRSALPEARWALPEEPAATGIAGFYAW